MLRVEEIKKLKDIYDFHLSFETPYFFEVSFERWEKSFTDDIDGQGRTLFKELCVKAVYDNDELLGFVQYGRTAFGFDENGEITSSVSYPVIRNLYFDKDRVDAGEELLKEAVTSLGTSEMIYAFFHYFGMSCFAGHGKLFEKHAHIEALLREKGFELEHENVYYSSYLTGDENSEVVITPQNLTSGNFQYIDFSLKNTQVGGCEVHYLDEKTVYLRWIYVNGDITGKGIGTKCMNALKRYIYEKGVRRFDTDTAIDNLVAQHYYEKNNFVREGVTRSFILKSYK